MWFVGGIVVGSVIGGTGVVVAALWVHKRRSSAAPKTDRLEVAVQTLRNISRVPKIEHAHKLAARALSKIESV